MKEIEMTSTVCPRCGRTYRDIPAISRADNKTLICPDCGTREALESIGLDAAEQDRVLAVMRRHGADGRK